MKPVQQPPALGVLITLALIVSLMTVAFVLIFAGHWYIGIPMFLGATLIFMRLRRTVWRYEKWCRWLEAQNELRSNEAAEINQMFEDVLREHDLYEKDNEL